MAAIVYMELTVKSALVLGGIDMRECEDYGTSYITDGWRIEELGKFVEPYIEDLIEGNKEYQQQ